MRDERFSVTLTILGTPRPVSAAVALALHRTTLEALTNVRKHANAATVEIELAFRDNGLVQLRVHDDGKGAVGETVGTGFGLRGIRERAEQLKGRASYRMTPNEGFTLDVWSGGSLLFAGTTDGDVFLSEDEGETWQVVNEVACPNFRLAVDFRPGTA